MPIDKETFEDGEEQHSIENEIIHYLYENNEEAYNVQEVADEVLQFGLAESTVERPDVEALVGCALDLATVNSILDKLVDNGRLKRRIVDAEEGKQSYYRAP